MDTPTPMDKQTVTVRILDNGLARQVNPLGERPSPKFGDMFANDVESSAMAMGEWIEAEDKCLTLPWNMTEESRRGQEPVSMANGMPPIWYAYIESDHFVLVKPLTTLTTER